MKKRLLLSICLGSLALSAAVPQVGVDLWKESNRYLNSHLTIAVHFLFHTATFYHEKEFYGGILLADSYWSPAVKGTFTRDPKDPKKGTVTFASVPGVEVGVQKNGNTVEFAFERTAVTKENEKENLYIRLNKDAMAGGISINGNSKTLTEKAAPLGGIKEVTIFPKDPQRCVTIRFSNAVTALLRTTDANIFVKPQDGKKITITVIPGQE